MSTSLRELKYVLYGEDRLSNKLNGVARSGINVSSSLKIQSERDIELRNSFKSAADEIPGLNRGMELLSNPLLLGAGALVGLGAAVSRSAGAAQQFGKEFRQLEMLNIDKPIKDFGRLKEMILDVAGSKGFDPSATSKAFFDVQSVTGKYGFEVSRIVEKQGEFANIMQADFNTWIAGTAKAMANYGFGAEKLDAFNKAAFATVKTGVTTFDELAKVQATFGGAAASAKQEFSAAGKVFSLFTVKVKNVDEAATLTKSLFTDLTKDSTISAFKKLGIDAVNPLTGKFKQADSLLLELNAKFKKLGQNDKELIRLKNQFSGSEGLNAFVQSAMGDTTKLQRMIKDFDNSEFSLSKALGLARKDVSYVQEQMQNKLKVEMTKLGDFVLPIKLKVVTTAVELIDQIKNIAPSDERKKNTGAEYAQMAFPRLINGINELTTKEYAGEIGRLKNNMDNTRKSLINGKSRDLPMFQAQYDELRSILIKSEEVWSKRPKDYDKYLKDKKNKDSDSLWKQDTTTIEDTTSKGIDSISGGGNAIRNITVNIQKLIETQQINTQNLTEGTTQVQQLVEAALIRAVSGTEQMISQ